VNFGDERRDDCWSVNNLLVVGWNVRARKFVELKTRYNLKRGLVYILERKNASVNEIHCTMHKSSRDNFYYTYVSRSKQDEERGVGKDFFGNTPMPQQKKISASLSSSEFSKNLSNLVENHSHARVGSTGAAGGLMSLGRAQARLAAISANETQWVVKQKSKMKNKGRVKVPYRTSEGRLLHGARGKIMYNDIPHTSFPWKTQQEENAEMLRACLSLPKISPIPRVSTGLHGTATGAHLQNYHEGKSKHKKEEPKKKVPVTIPDFPQPRDTSADGVMGNIQDLKRQDKLRSRNLKESLDVNAAPIPKRKDSRAERMKALEQKIIARGKLRNKTGADASVRPPVPVPSPAIRTPSDNTEIDSKLQFSLGFTATVEEKGRAVSAEGASGFGSWLDEFLTRN
jgi:hypothetical protein